MKASADFPTINSKKPDGLSPAGIPYKVLIIDDSIFIRKQISQILSSEGYEIAGQAGDGMEGIEMLKELVPNVDLITLDITMPRMDGVTCLGELLKIDPEVKVVMVSALGKQDLVKQAIITGAKNYIVKPLDRKKVLERLKSVLE